jgi:ZIP family zinc transporter
LLPERDIALLVAVSAAAFTFLGYPLTRWLSAGRIGVAQERINGYAMLFSALAMILVSALELVPSALGAGVSSGEALIWLLGGLVLYFAIDKLLDGFSQGTPKIKRSALTVAIALSLHNLPEGAATVASEFAGLESALSTGAALALHNIPEGATIALVALAAGFKPRVAWLLVAASALAEAAGGVAFWAANAQFDARASALSLLVVAALMLSISLIELLPRAFAALARDKNQTFNK